VCESVAVRPDDPSLGPTTVTVACVNFESVPRDKAATLGRMEARIAEAAARGGELVVFPELALNTWGECTDCAAGHRPCAWHRNQAEPADGPSCQAIIEMGTIHNSANVVAPDGLVGTYRKLHLGIPLETDRFTPGDALPVFHTDLGPIGIQICYDFYMGPELSRVLAMKGARLLINPTGRSALPRAREHLEQVTNVRAHENLIAAASANRVGTSHGPPTWAGGSVIATADYPGFPITLARAGAEDEVITATIDFATIGKWYDLLPWRDWRAGPQRPITDLVARELSTPDLL